MAADRNGYSDPYVKLSVGGGEKKTSRVVDQSLDPVWNQEFEFEGTLGHFASHALKLEVFDKDKLTTDDHLGTAEVRLDELARRPRLEVTQQLPTQGSLTLEVSWARVSERLLGKGALRDDHPLVLGMTGFWGTILTNQTCLDADVVFALGTRFKEADCSSWYPGYTFNIGRPEDRTKVIHIDIEAQEIGRNYPVEIGAVADARAALAVLNRVARDMFPEGFKRPAKTDEIAAFRAAFVESNREMAESRAFPMMPERILADPAEEYVADFVGAGATLKQLTLTRVGDVDLARLAALLGAADGVAGVQRGRQVDVVRGSGAVLASVLPRGGRHRLGLTHTSGPGSSRRARCGSPSGPWSRALLLTAATDAAASAWTARSPASRRPRHASHP